MFSNEFYGWHYEHTETPKALHAMTLDERCQAFAATSFLDLPRIIRMAFAKAVIRYVFTLDHWNGNCDQGGYEAWKALPLLDQAMGKLPEASAKDFKKYRVLSQLGNTSHLQEEPLMTAGEAIRYGGPTPDLLRNRLHARSIYSLKGLEKIPNKDSITDICFQANHISKLLLAHFAGWAHLQRLRLGHNKLTRFPAALLEALPNLEELELHENPLVQIPVFTMLGLPRLGRIELPGTISDAYKAQLARDFSVRPWAHGRFLTYYKPGYEPQNDN
jgi:hypothetical protein